MTKSRSLPRTTGTDLRMDDAASHADEAASDFEGRRDDRGDIRGRIYVHLAYGKNAAAYRRNFEIGLEPDETPYGFHLAAKEGFDVDYSADAAPQALRRKILRKLLGFDLLHAYDNRSRLRAAGAIWAMTEEEAFATAMLMALRVVPARPIVTSAVWLFDRWPSLPAFRKALYRRLAGRFSRIFTHSRACLPVAALALPDAPVNLIHFGINLGVFRPVEKSEDGDAIIEIFAAGNDRTRDWETLLEAFGNDRRFHLTIACPWFEQPRASAYANVTKLAAPAMADFIRAYAGSDFVAIPMAENIFSGITVALEAAAMEIPVICTRTGGVPTYFSDEEIFFVPAGDAAAMREVALSSTGRDRRQKARAARQRVLACDYTTVAMIHQYVMVTEQVLPGSRTSGRAAKVEAAH